MALLLPQQCNIFIKSPVFTNVSDIQFFLLFLYFKATKTPFFTCSRVGGSRGPIKSATYDINQTYFTLEFESRFESGNLQKAVQV